MKNIFLFTVYALLAGSTCSQPASKGPVAGMLPKASFQIIEPEGPTVQSRIFPPEGFERMEVEASSFAGYLRNFPLKPDSSPVFLFNGEKKSRQDVHAAVLDIDTGARDLQQCADAVMRLRAEYLFSENRFDDIHFNFTNGFRVDYSEWRKGKRIVVNGNRTHWEQKAQASNSYESFRKYMDLIFNYAGTLSLAKEMKPVKVEELLPGDVFIQGGSPGHAVIVLDMAVNKTTGEKLFLLAQSYMPAQDIHILKNLRDEQLSPWYSADFGDTLETPEWTFGKHDLKRF